MENLVLKKKENETVKFGALKISVDPIINFMRQTELNNLCIKQCESYGENLALAIPACKVLFDICVLALQTDLPITGVNETVVDGVYDLHTEMDYADIEEIVCSGIVKKVVAEISNYNEVWRMILKSIKMFNVKYCISKIGANLPTAQEMQEQVESMRKFVADNREFMDKAIINDGANEIYAETAKAQTEQKETATKEKKTTTKKKK